MFPIVVYLAVFQTRFVFQNDWNYRGSYIIPESTILVLLLMINVNEEWWEII